MPMDASFEQKFGQMVDAQINERLPSLVDFRIGFQCMDKNEDETHAVGVAAFVLNNIWLYIPVFFIEGDLRGFDLMYVKQKDVFVPSMDNWVAALKQRGIAVLGKSVLPNQRGRERDMFASPANTTIYDRYSQLGKTASMDANALIDAQTWSQMCRKLTQGDCSSTQFTDLPTDLPLMGKTANAVFVNTLLDNPEVTNMLLRFYDLDTVERMSKQAAATAFEQPIPRVAPIRVITDFKSKEAAELNDDQKQVLMATGIYVDDRRKEKEYSQVYQEEIDSSVIQSPTAPGIYDILMADGQYRKFMVLFPQDLAEEGTANRRSQANLGRSIALIDLKAPTVYIRKRSTEIFGKPTVDVSTAEVKAAGGSAKAATTRGLSTVKPGTRILLIHNGTEAIETRVYNRERNTDGSYSITVDNLAGTSNQSVSPTSDTERNTRARLEFVDPDVRMRVTQGCIFVPEGTVVLEQSTPEFIQKMKTDAQFTPDTVEFGNKDTASQLLHKLPDLRKLSIHADGGTAQIIDGERNTGLQTKTAALQTLICRYGIHGDRARQMLKDAAESRDHRMGFFCKVAAPFDTAAYGESQIPFMGGPIPRTEVGPLRELQTIGGRPLTGPSSADGQSMNVLPDEAIRRATQASEAGIKEVFDVSVLQGLLDKADISELRKDYVADMIRGMDKVGRMLFLFYWHNEDFENKYGKEDMQKLEDTLRDVFSSTGDLVLFLKEKTAYSPDTAEALFGNLSEDVAL